MKNIKTRLIALCLSCFLVAMFCTSCGVTISKGSDSSKSRTAREESEDKHDTNSILPGLDIFSGNITSESECWVAQTFSEVTDLSDIDATTFNEDYAFVRIRKEQNELYVIDKTGNIKFPLEINSIAMDELSFHNGLCFIKNNTVAYLIDTEGNQYKAEDFDGTVLHTTDIDQELLEGGYFIVDKVTSTFDGATRETAIYNTKCKQVHPYSSELYAFFHSDRLEFYNGYVIEDDTKIYHIATNTYGEYKDLPYAHKMDRTYYSHPVGSEKGIYRDSVLLMDLSQYETLRYVEYIGDNGIATFENEENDHYFSIIDTNGNLKFDPIYYGNMINNYVGMNNCFTLFNGNTIMTQTNINQPDNTLLVQIKTYDLKGNEKGALEFIVSAGAMPQIATKFGIDSIVIENHKNNTINYYDMNLEPMFSTE